MQIWKTVREDCAQDFSPGIATFISKAYRNVHKFTLFCTCSHREVFFSIPLVGDPGRDWTFISGLAGGCSIQLSYGAIFEALGICISLAPLFYSQITYWSVYELTLL